MRKKTYKGRCEKFSLSKCQGVCKTYDPIQMAYAMMLQEDESITEFWCNVILDTEEYTTDFLCTKASGEQMVRECVSRSHLTKPMTVSRSPCFVSSFMHPPAKEKSPLIKGGLDITKSASRHPQEPPGWKVSARIPALDALVL